MSTRRERAKAPATKLNKQLVAAEGATCAADKKRQVERSLGLWRSELFTDMAKLIFAFFETSIKEIALWVQQHLS